MRGRTVHGATSHHAFPSLPHRAVVVVHGQVHRGRGVRGEGENAVVACHHRSPRHRRQSTYNDSEQRRPLVEIVKPADDVPHGAFVLQVLRFQREDLVLQLVQRVVQTASPSAPYVHCPLRLRHQHFQLVLVRFVPLFFHAVLDSGPLTVLFLSLASIDGYESVQFKGVVIALFDIGLRTHNGHFHSFLK